MSAPTRRASGALAGIPARPDPLLKLAQAYFAAEAEAERIAHETEGLEVGSPEEEAVNDRVDVAASRMVDIFETLAQTPAVTVEGLREKMRVIQVEAERLGSADDIKPLVLAVADAMRLGGASSVS